MREQKWHTSSMALPQAKPPKKSTCYGEGSESALKKILNMLTDVNRICNLKFFLIISQINLFHLLELLGVN